MSFGCTAPFKNLAILANYFFTGEDYFFREVISIVLEIWWMNLVDLRCGMISVGIRLDGPLGEKIIESSKSSSSNLISLSSDMNFWFIIGGKSKLDKITYKSCLSCTMDRSS